jgi:hypothetical protein
LQLRCESSGTHNPKTLTVFNRASLVKERAMFEGLFQPMYLLIIFGIALLVFGPKKFLS